MDISNRAKQYWIPVLQEIMKYNIESPIKSKFLEAQFELAGATVREIIHFLRVDQKRPIGSKNGYFYARTREELKHTINDLRSRQRKIYRAEKGLSAAFEPEEQTSMFQEDKPKNKSNYDIE